MKKTSFKKDTNLFTLLAVIFGAVFLLVSLVSNVSMHLVEEVDSSFIFSYVSIFVLFIIFSGFDIYACKKYSEQPSDYKSTTNKQLFQIIKIIFFSWFLILSIIDVTAKLLNIQNHLITFNMECLAFLVSCDRIVSHIDKLFEVNKRKKQNQLHP